MIISKYPVMDRDYLFKSGPCGRIPWSYASGIELGFIGSIVSTAIDSCGAKWMITSDVTSTAAILNTITK
jgi:hypothetical protein|tara:strand:+ start:872 stop:1081 length:210 start_codon:yes stop_codon:yes gene_type:complete